MGLTTFVYKGVRMSDSVKRQRRRLEEPKAWDISIMVSCGVEPFQNVELFAIDFMAWPYLTWIKLQVGRSRKYQWIPYLDGYEMRSDYTYHFANDL